MQEISLCVSVIALCASVFVFINQYDPLNLAGHSTEVGKAMNALGYDAILKHDGDHTGQDFYVILNRGALEAKEKYIAART